jgi:cytochrome c-type biogenesis protein CcmH
MRYALFALLLMSLSMPALAVQPDEILKDPALEARARSITKELRCLVCQGEDIDESQAPLAADLRRIVRERIEKGDSDDQVIAYMRDRYGDYVLMRPPLEGSTALLWGAPLLVLVAGLAVAARFVRTQQRRKG